MAPARWIIPIPPRIRGGTAVFGILAAATLGVLPVSGTTPARGGQSSAIDSRLAPQGGDILRQYHEVNLAAMPLGAALQHFSARTGVALHYARADVAGRTSSAVHGTYSVLEGLTLVLLGTGITFDESGNGLALHPAAATTVTGSAVLRAAWDRFYRTIGDMRDKTEHAPAFADPRAQPMGYRALMEAAAMAYNFAIAPHLDFPRIQQATGWQTDFYTLGMTGPDGHYGVTFLDGRQTYRITGRLGGAKIFMIQVFNALMGGPGAKVIGNYIVEKDFKTGPDGSFDAVISADKHDGNWIRIDGRSHCNWFFIRRIMGDWDDDPGALTIKMISKPDPHFYENQEFDDVATAERIDGATDFLRYLVEDWNVGAYDMYKSAAGGRVNVMAPVPGTTSSQVGSPVGNYVNGVYHVDDDEALIVELRDIPRDAAYWGLQLGDVWFRGLDFVNHLTTINMQQAAIDHDGVFRAVISRNDPGVANWLDTTGHRDGTLVFRNYAGSTIPVPTVRRVKFADLRRYLPADTRMVTPEERRRQIEKRQAGMLKLLGE